MGSWREIGGSAKASDRLRMHTSNCNCAWLTGHHAKFAHDTHRTRQIAVRKTLDLLQIAPISERGHFSIRLILSGARKSDRIGLLGKAQDSAKFTRSPNPAGSIASKSVQEARELPEVLCRRNGRSGSPAVLERVPVALRRAGVCPAVHPAPPLALHRRRLALRS